MQERIIPEPSPGTMPEPNPHRLTPASPAFIGCDNPSINNGSISRDSVPLWEDRDKRQVKLLSGEPMSGKMM